MKLTSVELVFIFQKILATRKHITKTNMNNNVKKKKKAVQ